MSMCCFAERLAFGIWNHTDVETALFEYTNRATGDSISSNCLIHAAKNSQGLLQDPLVLSFNMLVLTCLFCYKHN